MSLNGNEDQSSTTSSSFAGKKRKNLVELTPSFTNAIAANPITATNNTILVAGSDSNKESSNGENYYLDSTGQELASVSVAGLGVAGGDMPPSKRQRSNISETSNENMNESFDDKQPNVEARFLIATKVSTFLHFFPTSGLLMPSLLPVSDCWRCNRPCRVQYHQPSTDGKFLISASYLILRPTSGSCPIFWYLKMLSNA